MRFASRKIAGWTAAALLLAGCGGGGGGTASVVRCDFVVEPRPAPLPYESNPYYGQQWYFHYDGDFYTGLRLPGGHYADPDAHIHPWPDQSYTGRGVKVAVIDDGLDVGHEDLKGAVVKVYDVATGTESVCPPSDLQNHGTEVTGVIAAGSNELGISGIAPETEIYFIRLPFEDYITVSQIVEAFEKAAEWGVDVVNCSWGSGEVDDGVKRAIVDLATGGRDGKGTVVVFAAGNGGYDNEGDPIGNDESSIPEVIAVGSTNIENRRSGYSNYGSALDIMAPGGEYVGITTLDQMGEEGLARLTQNYILYNDYYDYGAASIPFAGTSASAPIVTAVVAQMLQADPSLTRTQVYDLLTSNAEKFDPSGCGYDANGFSVYCGYGKVHVTATLNDLLR